MSPPLARAFGSRSLEGLVRDLRLAARSLARTPGFAVLTVAPLALGLALTACTLAVVNAIVEAQAGKLQDFANAFRIKRD